MKKIFLLFLSVFAFSTTVFAGNIDLDECLYENQCVLSADVDGTELTISAVFPEAGINDYYFAFCKPLYEEGFVNYTFLEPDDTDVEITLTDLTPMADYECHLGKSEYRAYNYNIYHKNYFMSFEFTTGEDTGSITEEQRVNMASVYEDLDNADLSIIPGNLTGIGNSPMDFRLSGVFGGVESLKAYFSYNISRNEVYDLIISTDNFYDVYYLHDVDNLNDLASLLSYSAEERDNFIKAQYEAICYVHDSENYFDESDSLFIAIYEKYGIDLDNHLQGYLLLAKYEDDLWEVLYDFESQCADPDFSMDDRIIEVFYSGAEVTDEAQDASVESGTLDEETSDDTVETTETDSTEPLTYEEERQNFIDATVEATCMILQADNIFDPELESAAKDIYLSYGFDAYNDEAMEEITKKYESDTVVQEEISEALDECGGDFFDLLNEKPIFDDLPEDHQYFEPMMDLYDRGIIHGYSDKFRMVGPDDFLSRAELLKMVHLASGEPLFEVDEMTGCFPDVHDEWFSYYVCYAKNKGYVHGYDDGTFIPALIVSKAEALKILLEYFGKETPGVDYVIYSDVRADDWFAPYFAKAFDLGIIPSLPENDLIYPEAEITRGEFSLILYKYLNK